MASEEEVANDLSGANELAAQGLRDLIGAGLVEAVREPNGKIGYRITEFGRGLSKEEADAILRRLDLLDYASDTEH